MVNNKNREESLIVDSVIMADNHFQSKHMLVERTSKQKKGDMGMINWKVRFKNRSWVMAFVAHLMIVAQMLLQSLNALGIIDFQLTEAIQQSILTFINAVFILLSLMGIVQDPTTKGMSDSERAKTYKEPN
jgi:phi LC3 family holin